jgi:prepilin-type N-terminal cleavage/methylation domain-containing protein
MKGRRKKEEGRRAATSSFIPLSSSLSSGFTLLEMIIVLVIIAILAASTIPAFNSAVNEHRVREDGHQLAMMVRQAMIQSAEQHRAFVMDLTRNTMSLKAQGDETKDDQDTQANLFKDSGSNETNSDQPLTEVVTQDVDLETTLDSPNKLQVPDADRVNGWTDVPKDGVEWVFQPGDLCPAKNVRIVRGDAYLELDFEALTGCIDTEKYYFP